MHYYRIQHQPHHRNPFHHSNNGRTYKHTIGCCVGWRKNRYASGQIVYGAFHMCVCARVLSMSDWYSGTRLTDSACAEMRARALFRRPNKRFNLFACSVHCVRVCVLAEFVFFPFRCGFFLAPREMHRVHRVRENDRKTRSRAARTTEKWLRRLCTILDIIYLLLFEQ